MKSFFNPFLKPTALPFLVGFLLCVAVISVYWQTAHHQFLNYDDNIYITTNTHVTSGLTTDNIAWAFTSADAANWHPLTWLSHMLDVELFGLNPAGHHLTNVAIHALNTVLLLLLLFRTTGFLWRSAFVATLFALHPLHVESVAWVAERKDVLSGLFFFLTLLVYAEYTKKKRRALYFLSLSAFLLGLMSKPMLVTLPLVMLLMDFWPLGRYGKAPLSEHDSLTKPIIRLTMEKIPFFVGVLLSCLITVYAQGKAGAVAGLAVVPVALRVENALVSYIKYIGKTLLPVDLAVLYPFPRSIPLWHALAALLLLIVISAAVMRAARRRPYLAVGWLWFVVMLVPVIGLVQVGSQSMADRYSYLPLVGLFVMATWAISELLTARRYGKIALVSLFAVITVASGILTDRQLRYWSDSFSLFDHTLKITDANSTIHTALGQALETRGKLDAAILEYEEAIRISPYDKLANENLKAALEAQRDRPAAMQTYAAMIAANRTNAMAHKNLATALAGMGKQGEAIREYREALQVNTQDADLHYRLGLILAETGDRDAAAGEYREALRLKPSHFDARYELRRIQENL